MQKSVTVLAGAVLAGVLGAAAIAQDMDSGLTTYVGLRGGLDLPSNAKASVPTTPTATSLRGSLNTGGGASLYAGVRLGQGLSVEGELFYRTRGLGDLTLNGAATPANGFVQQAGPMVNIVWEAPVDFPARPFLGAGVGAAWTQTSLHSPLRTDTYLTGSNWKAVYALMGGVKMPLSQSSRLTAMYRWSKTDGVAARCGVAGAATANCKYSPVDQSVNLGIEMDM